MHEFKGLGTALVTPFDDNLEINWSALDWLIHEQIDSGVDFLVPCGTTGESPTLSENEQIEVIEFVVKNAGNDLPILAGTGSNNTTEAVRLTQRAYDAGADGALVVSPYYNKPQPEGLLDYYSNIHEIGLPIILYDVPSRTSREVPTELIIKLARMGVISGVKWASTDINQLMDIIKEGLPFFTVFSGDDNFTFSSMALGGDGAISVVSNIIPQRMSIFFNSIKSGEWNDAREYNYQMLNLMRAMFTETNPIPVKTALSLMHPKIFGEKPNFRSPMSEMEPDNLEKLKEVLNAYKLA